MGKGGKGRGGKKKGKKAKHGGYYDVFDMAAEKLQDKVDEAVKDVSYLEKDSYNQNATASQEAVDAAEDEEEDYVSPYNMLLQTFKVKDGEKEKKKALKKVRFFEFLRFVSTSDLFNDFVMNIP
jgi:hypothetical protein